LGESGWLVSRGNYCIFNEYNEGCSRIGCLGDYLKGEFIIRFEPGTSEESAEGIINSFDLEIKSSYGFGYDTSPGSMVIRIPEGEEAQWTETLEGEEIITHANLNKVIGMADTGTSIPDTSTLLPLRLKKGISKKGLSNSIYIILGIAVIILIILFLVFRKKQ